MHVITLLSDWGISDHYVGSLKGTILRYIPDAVIVDISHTIEPYNIKQAAFVLRYSWRDFPKGTVHMIGMKSTESTHQPHILALSEGHFFISADNGLLHMVLDRRPDRIIGIEIPQDSGYFTFPERDRFVKVAAHLASGDDPGSLGEDRETLYELNWFKPVVERNVISGNIWYIDRHGNGFTNISHQLVLDSIGNVPFIVEHNHQVIRHVVKAYDDLSEAEIGAMFASNGLLEIALKEGNAQKAYGIKIDNAVKVRPYTPDRQ